MIKLAEGVLLQETLNENNLPFSHPVKQIGNCLFIGYKLYRGKKKKKSSFLGILMYPIMEASYLDKVPSSGANKHL